MHDGSSVEGYQKCFRQALSLILVFETLSVTSVEPDILPGDSTNDSYYEIPNSTTLPTCGGKYWVDNTAKVISIPHADNSAPFFCKWLLKANDSHHTIALSPLDVSLDFSAPGNGYRLEARDGSQQDSPLIGVLETSPEGVIKRADLILIASMKATSGFMLLQFWNNGYDSIQIDFAYYTCGGQVDTTARISSPIFTELSLLPTKIKCDWQLAKPRTSLYGYLRSIHLNVDGCCSLRLWSNSTLQVIEEIDQNSQDYSEKSSKSKFLDVENMSCPTGLSGSYMVPICDDSIRLVAFGSETATLQYISSNLTLETGFSAVYGTFKVPNQLQSSSKNVVWYLDYCALIIFTPLGVMIGAIIILYQNRRRGPERLRRPVLITKSLKRGSVEAFQARAASFHSERSRSGSFEKPPAKRTRSLTNIKPFATIPELQRSGKKTGIGDCEPKRQWDIQRKRDF